MTHTYECTGKPIPATRGTAWKCTMWAKAYTNHVPNDTFRFQNMNCRQSLSYQSYIYSLFDFYLIRFPMYSRFLAKPCVCVLLSLFVCLLICSCFIITFYHTHDTVVYMRQHISLSFAKQTTYLGTFDDSLENIIEKSIIIIDIFMFRMKCRTYASYRNNRV